jgi:PTS system nitrogen regulatory IIA component
MTEPAMKIMEILVRDALILNLGVRTKREVLVEMANALAKVEPQIEANRLLEVLLEREALQSTGIGEGVAIPHGKLVGLDRLVASFARSSEGVDFDSIDGQATHHFFLLVVPEHSGGRYLKALARISRFFRDTSFRQQLSEAQTAADVIRAIEDEDKKL